jgi:hypothetical protein
MAATSRCQASVERWPQLEQVLDLQVCGKYFRSPLLDA